MYMCIHCFFCFVSHIVQNEHGWLSIPSYTSIGTALLADASFWNDGCKIS